MTKITLTENQDTLIITPDIIPFDDEFELWAGIFLHHDEITELHFEQGADRHMMRFHYKNNGFSLNFEHYSESIWITPEGIDATALLPQLSVLLSQ